MSQDIILKIFQYVILLLALSLHEASHAWMASRLGDQTARMLGRVTLNPIKHIDPVGTVLIPLVMLFIPGYGRFLIGWARPTPVNTRNFKRIVHDDNMTTLAGPASNLLLATLSFVGLLAMQASRQGSIAVLAALYAANNPSTPLLAALNVDRLPALLPVALLLYFSVLVNLSLAVFNMLPLPPLDGSHIMRNALPYRFLKAYDSMGIFGFILIVFVGRWLVGLVLSPILGAMYAVLLRR